jgi:hypothetical protein
MGNSLRRYTEIGLFQLAPYKQALKKATFKPAAFYKGILIPLCASRTCTLREAVVLSSAGAYSRSLHSSTLTFSGTKHTLKPHNNP